jgi:hypothetical protein
MTEEALGGMKRIRPTSSVAFAVRALTMALTVIKYRQVIESI